MVFFLKGPRLDIAFDHENGFAIFRKVTKGNSAPAACAASSSAKASNWQNATLRVPNTP